MDFKSILENFNQNFTLFAIFPAVIGVGIYLTLKLRFVQVSHLKKSFQVLTSANTSSEGSISRFAALSTVLAGNFGTGNISGMAVAIATGGPGALVWMWIMAFFGAAIQYASCVLAISFRKQMKNGEYAGGPMYYLRDGLGMKKLSFAFCIFTLFGSLAAGNFAQINSIILPLEKMGLDRLYVSLGIAFFVGLVILGGIKRLSNFASWVVPFKAFLYLGTAAIIIFMNIDRVGDAFLLMIRHAFGFTSVVGGALGFGIVKIMTTGFDRGLFATDAGTGVVPILQSNARSEHPVIDGISVLAAPLMVMVVCTATGLVLILTGAWQEQGLYSTNMVTHAFNKGLGTPIGGLIVVVSLVLFAYTAVLTWAYCGEKALEFLIGPGKQQWFRYFYIAMVPVGSFLHVDLIWTMADIAITLMLFLNIVGIAGLSKHVIDSSREYRLSDSRV